MEKTNNKKLIASATLIVASIALLLGLTFAWFTDTVANKGNKIQAGTLKVQLYDTVTTASGTVPEKEITNAGEAIFGIEELREPGARTAEHVLRVANNGSVALKYEISFQKIDEGPSGSAIENVIDVYLGGQKSGVLADYLSGAKSIVSPDGVLAAGASTTLPRVQLAMQETAGNQYQGMQTQFDVILVATQATGEADGFGNVDYDKDATYPWDGVTVTPVAPDSNGAYNLSSGAELAWVSQEVASGTFGSARSGAGPVVVLQNDIDLGGNEWIPIGGDVAFTGTFDGNGHTITGLTASSNALADDPTRGVALFGYAENATIKNLKIDGCSLSGRYAVAAVVGDGCAPLVFENVEVLGGTIRADQNSGERIAQVAGGLLGQGFGPDGASSGESIVFRNCTNGASVFVNKQHAGGLWGSITQASGVDVKAENCSNRGAITVSENGVGYAGGLGAYVSAASCTVSGCSNSGIVSAPSIASNFVAWCNGESLDGNAA